MSKKMFLVVVLLVVSLVGTAVAGLRIPVPPLPRIVVSAPPVLAVIPGTYVYLAPDVNADLMFYQNNWYRPHNGGWYVSQGYNGPWRAVSAPPPALTRLPQNYRSLPPGHERMPYGQVKDNWRTWEHDRRWDHPNGHREDRRADRREERREDRREARREDRREERREHHQQKRHHDDDHDGRGGHGHDR